MTALWRLQQLRNQGGWTQRNRRWRSGNSWDRQLARKQNSLRPMELRRPAGTGLRYTNPTRWLKKRKKDRKNQHLPGGARRLRVVLGETTKAAQYEIGATSRHCRRSEGRAREKRGEKQKTRAGLSLQLKYRLTCAHLFRKSVRLKTNHRMPKRKRRT